MTGVFSTGFGPSGINRSGMTLTMVLCSVAGLRTYDI